MRSYATLCKIRKNIVPSQTCPYRACKTRRGKLVVSSISHMIQSCQRLRRYSYVRSAPCSIHPTLPWNNFTNVQELLPRTGEIFTTAGDLAEEGLHLFSNELAGATDSSTGFCLVLVFHPGVYGCTPTVLPRRR